MLVVISKTSNSKYIAFKNFYSFEDLIKFLEKNKNSLIVQENWFYQFTVEDLLKDNYNKLSKEQIEKLVSCKYEIEIYDDYRE